MALLERVTTLIRANLNDLIDKAEDPEKMLKQVILDMQNQLMQVKTQVAIAMADQHLLAQKQKENEEAESGWMRKAGLAVGKNQEELARAAVERALSHRQIAGNFQQQHEDQHSQVEVLKSALRKLEQKLAEAQSRCELMISQHRRARAVSRASDARAAISAPSHSGTFNRMKDKVMREEAMGRAKAELTGETLEDKLIALDRGEEVDRLIEELKNRNAKP